MLTKLGPTMPMNQYIYQVLTEISSEGNHCSHSTLITLLKASYFVTGITSVNFFTAFVTEYAVCVLLILAGFIFKENLRYLKCVYS